MEIIPLTSEEEKSMGLLTRDGVLLHRLRVSFTKLLDKKSLTEKEKIEFTCKLTNYYARYCNKPPQAIVAYIYSNYIPKDSAKTDAESFLLELYNFFNEGKNGLLF